MKPAFVFDFDGTLAQTLDLARQAYDAIAEEHGFSKMGSLDRIKGKGVREVSRMLNVPLRKVSFVMRTVRAGMHDGVAQADPFPGVPEMLEALRSAGHRTGILTSNAEDNVRAFLAKNGLQTFDFIYSGSSAFGKHRVLRRLMREHGLAPANVIYVGDETRDIEACRKAGVRIIAVAWGLHDRATLEALAPDWIAGKPADVVTYAATA